MVKKWLALMLALMCILLCACKEEAPIESLVTDPTVLIEETIPPGSLAVGVCLPGSDSRWSDQGQLLAAYLEDIGHTALVRYTDSATTQKKQLQELLAVPVDCIVLAAVDALSLTDVLQQAKNQNIPVVALERMLVYSDAAAVCLAMDSRAAGRQMAQYIINNMTPTPEAPKTVEFFMGSPEDQSAIWLYQGVMEILKPYLNSGALVCKSGRVSFEDTCTQGDLLTVSQAHCLDFLSAGYYKNTRPDILLCAADVIAEGCILALEEKPKQLGDTYPVITSVGASPDAVKRIVEGKQTMSVYCDIVKLAQQCAKLTDLLLSGKALPELPLENTGAGQVPCMLVEPSMVDFANYRQVVVEEGSYSLWQVLPEGYVEPEPIVPEPTDPSIDIPLNTIPMEPVVPPTEPTVPEETVVPTEATTPAETTAPTETTITPTQTA